ncbi:MAG: hypothetical protein LBR16_01530 [Treponema sp.]|jgi:hypothetical protein|nr:hypothetical protein [Treponema sp.]
MKNKHRFSKGHGMKKYLCIAMLGALCLQGIPAQETEGKQIENLRSAVKTANPGDYILLPSGHRYVLGKAEIAIVNGVFNYEDLSDVPSEKREDGTEIKHISASHSAYLFPDGQSTHVIKTGAAFGPFREHLRAQYKPVPFMDVFPQAPLPRPKFDVFRARVRFQLYSDGQDELQVVEVTAYNWQGMNFLEKLCSQPGFSWGRQSSGESSYKPVGETHTIEFADE